MWILCFMPWKAMKMSWMENFVPVSTWVAKNSFPTILSSLPDFSHFLNPENCSSIFNPEHHVRQNKEKKINWHWHELWKGFESGHNRSQSVKYSIYFDYNYILQKTGRSHGVMVSTLDSESSDPSSNLGGTWDRWSSYKLSSYFFLSALFPGTIRR